MPDDDNCPVCKTPGTRQISVSSDRARFECRRCGDFELSGSAVFSLPQLIEAKVHRRALMSHLIRRASIANPKNPPFISTSDFENYWRDEHLSSATQQANELLLWIGDNQLAPNYPTYASPFFLAAWVGTALLNPKSINDGLLWLCDFLTSARLLDPDYETDGDLSLQLTMEGWERYSTLKTTQRTSRTAFIAMKFGDSELDALIDTTFKPSVAAAGFELRRLTDSQPAGLIDNQIRASILSAKFVVADLTHANLGAYWEAGFAEGAGLKVIYTCRQSVWEAEKTHFDTNHLMTIPWDPASPEKAGKLLTATIRSTFPADATPAP